MIKWPSEKCVVCGSDLVVEEVEKILRGGPHTAVIRVEAQVCHRCGEQLFDIDTVRRFEQIRQMLKRGDTAGFTPIGQSFQVA